MIVRCYGARGSIAVSGAQYLTYGGDTTCLEIRSASGHVVVVDAGTGIRRLGRRLDDEGVDHISLLLTHGHWDHLLGFPFFRPAYGPGCRIDLHGYPQAGPDVLRLLARTMAPPYFPISFHDLPAEIHPVPHGSEFAIGSLEISTIPLSHPDQGLGYRFREDGQTFVFLTDNELDVRHAGGRERRDYVEFCAGADLLLHDAEFLPQEYERTRGWGHSRHTDALELALDAGVRRLGLFHHNQDRDDAGVTAMAEECRQLAQERGATLACGAVRVDEEFVLPRVDCL